MTALQASEQLEIELGDVVTPDYAPRASIEERYAAWATANPWVLPALERLVADWLAAGHTRVGIKQVWEVLRWQHGRSTTHTGHFRANNDFTSRAARDLIARHPEWADAIETRALRSL